MNPFLLLLIGFFFIFLEFFLPGAIFGIIGGLLSLTSIFLFAASTDSSLAIFLFILMAIIGFFLLIKFAIWRIKSTKSKQTIYSDLDQEGYQASSFDPTAIGKKGKVLADLKPGGYILIEGEQHSAISCSGYLPKDSQVEVIRGEGESLIVKKIEEEL